MPVVDTQLQNLIKVTKVRKENNYEPYDVLNRRLCLRQPVPACSLTHGCVTMLSVHAPVHTFSAAINFKRMLFLLRHQI